MVNLMDVSFGVTLDASLYQSMSLSGLARKVVARLVSFDLDFCAERWQCSLRVGGVSDSVE